MHWWTYFGVAEGAVNEDHGEVYARAAVQWREGGEAQQHVYGPGCIVEAISRREFHLG